MSAVRTATSRVIRVATVLLLASLAVACSAGGTPEASRSAGPSQEEVTYYRCLEKEGLVLEELEDSSLRVDKDEAAKDPAGQTRAEAACRGLVPKAKAPEVTAEQIARAKEFSACVRARGISDYPDPDPGTGETRLPEKFREGDMEALRSAQRACGPGAGGSSDNLGG